MQPLRVACHYILSNNIIQCFHDGPRISHRTQALSEIVKRDAHFLHVSPTDQTGEAASTCKAGRSIQPADVREQGEGLSSVQCEWT